MGKESDPYDFPVSYPLRHLPRRGRRGKGSAPSPVKWHIGEKEFEPINEVAQRLARWDKLSSKEREELVRRLRKK